MQGCTRHCTFFVLSTFFSLFITLLCISYYYDEKIYNDTRIQERITFKEASMRVGVAVNVGWGIFDLRALDCFQECRGLVIFRRQYSYMPSNFPKSQKWRAKKKRLHLGFLGVLKYLCDSRFYPIRKTWSRDQSIWPPSPLFVRTLRAAKNFAEMLKSAAS